MSLRSLVVQAVDDGHRRPGWSRSYDLGLRCLARVWRVREAGRLIVRYAVRDLVLSTLSKGLWGDAFLHLFGVILD